MLCDIDNFKQVNDRLSHAIGDEVLRQIAQLFTHHTRDQDIVARYGGEEFVIVFPETTLVDAASACENLRQVVARHPWHSVHPNLRVTLSMGIADRQPHTDNYEDMLKAADTQMYRAKTSGKNRVCFAASSPLDNDVMDTASVDADNTGNDRNAGDTGH